MSLHLSVILFTGDGGLCPEGVSIQGVSVWESLSRGVSVQGSLCPGKSLSRDVSVWGETPLSKGSL